jgi:hypothetical protein
MGMKNEGHVSYEYLLILVALSTNDDHMNDDLEKKGERLALRLKPTKYKCVS